MKHLKLFEYFQEKDYYLKISEDEYDSIESIEFEDKLAEDILSMLKDGWEMDRRSGSYMVTLYNENGERDWHIGQSLDEWFFADSDLVGEDWDYQHNFYKCDQFEGLLQLLKDNQII